LSNVGIFRHPGPSVKISRLNTAAFVHAPIDEPPNFTSLSTDKQKKTGVFVAMPRGFSQPNKVLKLKKSLYGLKQAPRNFFLHLKGQLESIGLVSQQDLDPCPFISDKVICLVYVDDTLFYSSKESYINNVI
jgi:Reverse transcriptase (RNA-dependent DNA polymerase)